MATGLTALWCGGCGSKLPYVLRQNNVKTSVGVTGPLQIALPNSDGQIEDLSRENGKPTVVFFAQELCLSCTEEINMIKANLKNANSSPTGVNLYSILLGASLESAKNWKKDNQISWTVLHDFNSVSIRQYCPKIVLPCVMIHKPNEGIVFLEQRKVSFDELQTVTGSWE